MRKLLILFFILAGYLDLSAQDSIVTVKAGYKISDVLKPGDIYYLPEFKNGKVLFKNSSQAAARLNYNLLYGQMLFIGPKGDTLALADEKNVKSVIIEKDTFFFDEGYIRLFANENDIKLGAKQVWVLADIRKGGTHNRSTNTVAITSMDMYTDETIASKSKSLIMNEDMILRKVTHYYFGDKFNYFVRASKKGLLQLFANHQDKIENYLKENKVNFDKKEDIEKVTQFLVSIK